MMNRVMRTKMGCLMTVISVFLMSCYGQSQPVNVYYAMNAINKNSRNLLDSASFNNAYTIYQVNIDPDDVGILDVDKFKEAIISSIPEKSDIKLGIIDWEGNTLRNLSRYPANHKEFKAISAEFIKAVKIAKELRPNLKWGFYDIPMRRYFNKDKAWLSDAMKLLPILEECDYIAPSLYMIVPHELEEEQGVKGYIDYNLKLALDMGERIDKPVLPFVWHRYIEHFEEYGYKLIENAEFTNYITEILSIAPNGKGVDGLIWWSNDGTIFTDSRYKSRLTNLGRNSFDKEMNYNVDRILKNYTDRIKNVKRDSTTRRPR